MAFNQLAYIDQVSHLDEALAIIGSRDSNGMSIRRKSGATGADFLKRLGNLEYCYNRVPIKTPLIQNGVLNDFVNVRDRVGGNLVAYEYPLVEYFSRCYNDIVQNTLAGVDMSAETVEWEKALNAQERHVQQEVTAIISPLQAEVRKHRQKVRIKNLRSTIRRPLATAGKKVGLHKLRDWLTSSHSSTPKPSAPIFPDIWAALKWEEEQAASQTVEDG